MSENMTNRVLSGRYKIAERIGVGGMAEVYRAQDTVLGRVVAVKVMLPQYAADATFTQRFRHEAASAANLQSPYIVNVYDWGQDQGTFFIVMEYVRGSDLKTGIRDRGAINQRKVAEIGIQVCQALNVAHRMDIIHRDIKPQNIMVQPDGNVKVMDFGIARAKNSVESQTSSVLGTAHYISPEQAQGKELTGSSDIYSLGVVLYEAATGQLPFDGPDAVSVALKQVNSRPVPPRQVNPAIDPKLEAIILKAMAKHPQDRFATANEMRQALSDFLTGKPLGFAQGTNPGETVAMNAAGMAAPDSTSVMPAGAIRNRSGAHAGRDNTDIDHAEAIYAADKWTKEDSANLEKKSKTGLVIGIIAAIVVIAGVLAFFFLGAGSSPTVPDVTGKTLADAKTAIVDAGFSVGEVTEASSSTVEAGKVISQAPKGETTAEKGSAIGLVVSKGAEKVTVPDLLKMTSEEAQKALEKLGLTARNGEAKYSTDYEQNHVMSQDPVAGTQVEKGSTVTYVLSLGTESVTLPNVVGKKQEAAIKLLQDSGFNYGVSTEYSSTVAEGTVISQTPAAGDGIKADKGTYVSLVVSAGVQKGTVPDVVGLTVQAARQALWNAGFTNINAGDYADDYIVTSVTPDGEQAYETQITLKAKKKS